MLYEYKAEVVEVHDGDTLTVSIDLGFSVTLENEHLRLYGLDAPELSSPAGKTSAEYAQSILPSGTPIMVRTIKDKKEKYGRYLAIVFLADGRNFNEMLIATGMAKVWDGKGPRP